MTQTGNFAATTRLLRTLLEEKPQYRRLWLARVERDRDSDINLAAVSRVLSEYLWEAGERPDTDRDLPRDIKDRVRRALTGQHLTAETLNWFLRAFEMTDDDEESLWATYTRRSLDRGIAHTMVAPRPMAKPQRHRTLALFERYIIDLAGRLSERHTYHVILAMEDGVDGYMFNHEADVDAITVAHQGRVGGHYEYGGGLQADEILIDRTLRKGESASIEYHTSYRGDGGATLELRRPARRRAENVDTVVRFHPQRLPCRCWWSVWADHIEGTPVLEEPVVLGAEGTLHRFLPYIEQTVVGWRWEW